MIKINSIEELIANTKKTNVKAGEGTFNVKIVDIEDTKSQKGAPMIKATFEVLDGDSKGAIFRSNWMKTIKDETEMWKFRDMWTFTIAYGIPQEKFNNDMVEEYSDLFTTATACLKKALKKDPIRPICCERVKREDSEYYTNKFSLPEVKAESATSDDEDDFLKALKNETM